MKTVLVTAKGGDGSIYLSNGVTRVHVGNVSENDQTSDDETVLRDTRWVGAAVLDSLVRQDVSEVADLDAFGAEIPRDFADRFRAMETAIKELQLGGIDYAKLAAAVVAAMPAAPSAEEIADAVADEQHQRLAS